MRRWNLALQHVREIETRIAQHGATAAPTATPSLEECHQLSQQLESIWTDPATSVRLKKRIVRTLIDEVLVDVDGSAGELILTLHWKGGAHTELRLPRRRRGQCSTQTSRELMMPLRFWHAFAAMISSLGHRRPHPFSNQSNIEVV